jgi:outer membrane protein OmpA-like peptidoglycan-associated protein
MMKQKKINPNLWLSLLSVVHIYGCAVAVIGIGAAGAGAFAYLNGKLTKTYESEYHETVRASSVTLEELKIPVSETTADELKTDIKAQRPDGTPVTIEVVRIDPTHTQVAVRTGSLGAWDRRVSEQIHGFIDNALNQKAAGEKTSSKRLAPKDLQATTGEKPEPGVIEEDLAESSDITGVPAATPIGPAGQEPEKKPIEAAHMIADSVFVIFFGQNSNELTQKATEKLDRVFEILRQNSETAITINGYSDSLGSTAYNNMISEIRANAVKSYLIAKGVSPARMTAFGHGSQKFIGSNKTEQGRRLNRRVEIELNNP